MVIASSISGLPIYAPSAGFAPTNSGEVSAIASAYQVVSSTATQLYAGTAYVTSVNDAPISASRAGNAANASLASSAWYDGTGRLISSLPDSAAVSAIASAYAESAASGKQDELTFSYDDDKISAINGSALAGQGGGEQVVTSLQYAVSDPTSKYELYQPAGTTGSYMSSNLLAIDDPEYGMGQYDMSGLSSFDVFMTGMDSNFEYYSATMSAMIVKASASGRQPWAWSPSDTAFGGSIASVQTGYDEGSIADTGSARVVTDSIRQYGSSWPDGTPFYIQPPLIFFTTASGNSFFQGTARIGTAYGSASYVNTALEGESSVSGVNELPIYIEKDTSVSAIAETYAQSAAKSAVSSVSGDYYPRYSNPSNFVPSSAVVMQSSVGSSDKFITGISGTPVMATDSAYTTRVSDTASATSYQTAFANFGADAVSRSVFVRLNAPERVYITAYDSDGYTVGQDVIYPVLDPSNYTYTGQYNVTSTAAVSAGFFAFNYLSASAICGYTVPLAHASAVSNADWLETASSAPSYIENKPDLVDIVAGPGIHIDNPDGNTLRVSMAADYETVLWETTSSDVGTVAPIALSESIYNFEKIKIVGRLNGNNSIGAPMSWEWYTTDIPVGSYLNCFGIPINYTGDLSLGVYLRNSVEYVSANNSLTHTKTYSWQLQGTALDKQTTDTWGQLRYFRVVGIHRIANN